MKKGSLAIFFPAGDVHIDLPAESVDEVYPYEVKQNGQQSLLPNASFTKILEHPTLSRSHFLVARLNI